MNVKDTAERIRGLRTAAGMSQASFASMCGIEQGQLCNYEMARIMPTIPLCERICRAGCMYVTIQGRAQKGKRKFLHPW